MGEDNAKEQPIIIIKKITGHGGHHGGAWKVAYADFVTAMMALFMVLWLLNASQETQKAIGGYFTDPQGNGRLIGSDMAGAGGDSVNLPAKEMESLKDKIAQSLKQSTKFKELQDKITMVVTGEGLRIELLESDIGTFFESGSPVPTVRATEILGRLAREVGELPNKVSIEGHTDSKKYAGEYSNWELSSDRANTARRIMQAYGVRQDQVAQIRGFADQSLRKKGGNAEDPSNRRISIIVQHLTIAKKAPEVAGGDAKKDGHAVPAADAQVAAKHEEPKKPASH